MKSVLYPAIALMSQLSFAIKFSLISILFFLPMVITNFFLVRDSYQEFVDTRTEMRSLELLKSSIKLRRGLEQLSDLLEVSSALGQASEGEDLSGQIDSLLTDIDSQLDALVPSSADAQKAAEFGVQHGSIKSALAAMQHEESPRSKIGLMAKVLDNTDLFVKIVASQAGLSLDADVAVRQMTELITTVTPQVTRTLSKGRALGASSLGRHRLGSSEVSKLDELLAELEKLSTEYNFKIQNVLQSRASAQLLLEGAANTSRATLIEANRLLGILRSSQHRPSDLC